MATVLPDFYVDTVVDYLLTGRRVTAGNYYSKETRFLLKAVIIQQNMPGNIRPIAQ
jgi:hypothetical protein